uniref:Uncharacterized protein n=1 Tax=Globodera rostochiensis TaxID=31243 RepID=A0A914I7H4_GLORO
MLMKPRQTAGNKHKYFRAETVVAKSRHISTLCWGLWHLIGKGIELHDDVQNHKRQVQKSDQPQIIQFMPPPLFCRLGGGPKRPEAFPRSAKVRFSQRLPSRPPPNPAFR